MLGMLESMPPGQEFNRWTLPLDQAPYRFMNFMHWGKALLWNTTEGRHNLHDMCSEAVDIFFWMTKNKEVELRARSIEDDDDRELFYRIMGGHWSKQHQKNF